MQTAIDLVPAGVDTLPNPSTISAGEGAAERQVRVSTGQTLFAPGAKRHLYRVKSGAVCHYARWPDGRLEVIAFAFPGDLIGFGYLFTHTSSAVAMVDTVLSSVSGAALDHAQAHDVRFAFGLADAGEREFEFLRMTTRPVMLLPPLRALARYLLAITSLNATEGRGTLLASDDVLSVYVAGQLHMTIETLSMALLSLTRSGLVEVCGKGWRIGDAARLEALAERA